MKLLPCCPITCHGNLSGDSRQTLVNIHSFYTLLCLCDSVVFSQIPHFQKSLRCSKGKASTGPWEMNNFRIRLFRLHFNMATRKVVDVGRGVLHFINKSEHMAAASPFISHKSKAYFSFWASTIFSSSSFLASV